MNAGMAVSGFDEVAAAIAQLLHQVDAAGRTAPGVSRTEVGGDLPSAVLISGVGPGAAGGVVVAAVDDDTCPGRVIKYAVAEAGRRGVPVRVVHVWTGRATTLPGLRRERHDQMSDADLLLSEVLYDHLTPAQAAATEREILHDSDVGRALIALSAEAALMVVAPRSTPTGDGEPLGRTVRELVGRTVCPLAVLAPGGPGPITRPGC